MKLEGVHDCFGIPWLFMHNFLYCQTEFALKLGFIWKRFVEIILFIHLLLLYMYIDPGVYKLLFWKPCKKISKFYKYLEKKCKNSFTPIKKQSCKSSYAFLFWFIILGS